MHNPLALLLAVVLTAPLAARAQTPPFDSHAAEALGADLFAHSGSTGMVLVLVHDREVFFRGYGETAPGSGQAPTPDSTLRLCSLSKIFASDLLVKLLDDHLVRLDDPLQRYAPPGAIVPAKQRPITLGDLVTHTAGLPREVTPAPSDAPHFTFPDFDERWHWLPKQHPRTPPGTAALYSNVGFDLLGDALQSAAHQPYAQLLAARTLTPLNLRHTTFTPTAVQCAALMLSAHHTPADDGPCTSTLQTAASSGLYSTASDMALWLEYLLGEGPPTAPPQNPAALAPYLFPANLAAVEGLSHAGDPTGIGLGWIHLLPLDSPSHLIQKTGGGAGFFTYIALLPSRHLALFFAATEGPPHSLPEPHRSPFKIANDVLLSLAGLPPLPPEPLPTPAPVVRKAKPQPRAHKSHGRAHSN